LRILVGGTGICARRGYVVLRKHGGSMRLSDSESIRIPLVW
jgi:hypothetical protein